MIVKNTPSHTTPSHTGLGLYPLADASRLIGVPASTLHAWLNPDKGIVARQFDPEDKVVTFIELMELHFIRMFREHGVSLQTIRQASLAAAEKFDTPHPFSVKRFDTDGKTVFATLIKVGNGAELVEDLKKGQHVFATVIKPFFRKLDYQKNESITRFWPLEKTGRIVLDPSRKFGAPIDAPTGIPTRTIYDATIAGKNGQDKAIVAHWLGIPVEAVEAAVLFEQSLAK